MDRKLEIIDPVHEKRWDEFLARQPYASVFHTSAWAKSIREAYGYQPCYLVLENADGQYAAGIPLFLIKSRFTGTRLVCLPFSDYCYPLSENPEDIAILLNAAKEDMADQGATYLEIRGWPSGIPDEELGLLPFHYHLSHSIDLKQNIDALEKKFSTNARRSIRKALKNNVLVRRAESESDLKDFYRFNVQTRKKNGVIPQPYSYFQSVYRNLVIPGVGYLSVAEWQGEIIAASIFLVYKDTIYYKYNASDRCHLGKCPNHLLVWEAIKQAYDDGLVTFDLGRCSPDDEGLRTFKNRWGAQEMDLPCYYYPVIKGTMTYTDTSLKYKIMNQVVGTMPDFLLKAIGSKVYKHLG